MTHVTDHLSSAGTGVTASATTRPGRRMRVARYLVGYVAVAAILPYLSLKLAWLSGSTVGWADPELARGSGLYSLNIATAGMDVVALAAALTFTHRWGRRVPGWLVLFPLWVGTGFLAPIVLVHPFNAVHAALTGAPVTPPESPLESWVPPLVYTGFTVQGLALLTAFVLYAISRWPSVFRTTVADVPAGSTAGLQRVVGPAAALLAGVVGAVHLFWAVGGTFGIPASLLAGRGLPGLVVDGVFGAFAVGSGLGLLALVVRRGPTVPYWLPLTLTWTGAGSLFAWGLYNVVNTLGGTALGAAGEPGMAIYNLTSLAGLLAGTLVGTVAAFVLAERDTIHAHPAGGRATTSGATRG